MLPHTIPLAACFLKHLLPGWGWVGEVPKRGRGVYQSSEVGMKVHALARIRCVEGDGEDDP
jgi:hypothetical protein